MCTTLHFHYKSFSHWNSSTHIILTRDDKIRTFCVSEVAIANACERLKCVGDGVVVRFEGTKRRRRRKRRASGAALSLLPDRGVPSSILPISRRVPYIPNLSQCAGINDIDYRIKFVSTHIICGILLDFGRGMWKRCK